MFCKVFGKAILLLVALTLLHMPSTTSARADEEVDFDVVGVGNVFNPILESPFVEFQAVGKASFLGAYKTTRSTLVLGDQVGEDPDSFEFFNFDDPPVIKFRSFRGTLAFTYDASRPGVVTLFPVDGGKFVGYFVAEFNPAPEFSTGNFANFIGGGFIMYAITEPFSPGDEDVKYVWFGSGKLIVDDD